MFCYRYTYYINIPSFLVKTKLHTNKKGRQDTFNNEIVRDYCKSLAYIYYV